MTKGLPLRLFPATPPMLGAGQRDLKTNTSTSFLGNGGSILWMPCVHAMITRPQAL
jgi:hypothetical protein